MDRLTEPPDQPSGVTREGFSRGVSTATRRRVLRRLGPVASSTLVHGLLLLVLGLWTIPILERGSLLMTLLEQGEAIDLDESMRSVDDPPKIASEVLLASALDTNGMLAELPTVAPMPETTLGDSEPLGPGDATTVEPPMRVEASIGSGRPLHDAATIEAAVDRVTGGIRGRLEKGDLLVVWLLDASK